MQANVFSKADALRPVALGSGASSTAATRRARAATTTSAETTRVQRAPPELTARVENGARVPTPMQSDARSAPPVIVQLTDVVSTRSAPADVGILIGTPTDWMYVRHGHSAAARLGRQVAPDYRPVREVMHASTRTGRSGTPLREDLWPVFIQSAQLPSDYALTRTAVDKCEFIANAVPACESRAASPNSTTTRSPTHRWCSEFLLLHYDENNTLKLVYPNCISDGMEVMLIPRHGDLGLLRNATPGDAAAGDQERGAANGYVLQFIGFKDNGHLFFSHATPTTKTRFYVAHASSKGFALRTEVGSYLCVDGTSLAVRPNSVHTACTFRFTFVPNPLNDAHLPRELRLSAAVPPVAPSTASRVTPPILGSIAHSPTDVYATTTASGTSSVVVDYHRQTRQSQQTVRSHQQWPSQALQPNRVPAAHGGAPATASSNIPPPLPPRDAGPVPAALATSADDLSAETFSAVTMRDHKGRYLICERHGSHGKADGANHSNDDETGDLGVLRLSNSRDKNDKRVVYFEMLMLPPCSQPAADGVAGIDAAQVRRTFIPEDLERAEPFKLAKCSGRRVVFKCGEKKYLAVRLPLSYNPDDAALRTDQELYDEFFACGFDDEADGTLILVSQPSIAAVFTYSKAPDPLVFFLQSVALGTFVKFDYTPRAIKDQAVDRVLGAIQSTRQAVLGRWRKTSDAPVRAHVGARITDVRADKWRLNEGTAMTLVVKQPLGQALRDQAEETKLLKDRTKTRTMLATAAITGAPLVGVAAGVANTVHGAGKQTVTFVESAKSQGEGITAAVMDLPVGNAAGVPQARAIDAVVDATAPQDTVTPAGISVGPAVTTTPHADTGMQLAKTSGTTTGTAADYGCTGFPDQWLNVSTANDYGSRIDFPDQWLNVSTTNDYGSRIDFPDQWLNLSTVAYDAPRAPNDPTLAIPDAARINSNAPAVCCPAQDIHVADAITDQGVVPDPALPAGFHAEIHVALHAQFDAECQLFLDPSAGVHVDTSWDMSALSMHDGRHHANACAW
ncbi:hypothetical protein GGF31_004877 [Allomyces arbusculus]|nr:hypothetical protein GGF31_004877 [Allomyces arbusculus]